MKGIHMWRWLPITFLIILLSVSPTLAQTPFPTPPLPFSPQAAPVAAQLDSLSVALLTILGAVVAGATGYIGAWFKRRTDAEANKTLVKAEAEKTKATLDKKSQAVKEELEEQAAADQKELRGFFKQQNDELKLELRSLRDNTDHEIAEVRQELREARTETKAQTQITDALQKKVEEGHQREEKLRKDVDHMPQEIARLEALLVKKGNGDGQGASKSVLNDASQERVDAAKDDES